MTCVNFFDLKVLYHNAISNVRMFIMKKIVSVTLSSAVALLLLGGCGSSPQPSDPSLTKNALYTNIKDDEKLKKIVVKAAKEKGWRVTEFKRDAIIVEKPNGENAKSATVKILHGNVDFEDIQDLNDDDIVDLREYIDDLTKEEQ